MPIGLTVWHYAIQKAVVYRLCESIRVYIILIRTDNDGREVHMSDLIKAQEVNDDFKSDCPSMIHWGKFNMMGRFISTTLQCQVQCSNTTDYDFPERPQIAELFVKRPLMGFEVQLSLIHVIIILFIVVSCQTDAEVETEIG